MVEKRFDVYGVKFYAGDKAEPEDWLASYDRTLSRDASLKWFVWGCKPHDDFKDYKTEAEARKAALKLAMIIRMTK